VTGVDGHPTLTSSNLELLKFPQIPRLLVAVDSAGKRPGLSPSGLGPQPKRSAYTASAVMGMTFQIWFSRKADETMLAAANPTCRLSYALAVSFAKMPSANELTANMPNPGLEAPSDSGNPTNGNSVSMPTTEHARKTRANLNRRLWERVKQ